MLGKFMGWVRPGEGAAIAVPARTSNSAIYAEYIREMALLRGWALKTPSASKSGRTAKGSMIRG